MKNPCNNCKTRWLCKPYGGKCWRKKRYIKKISRSIADKVASDFQNYCEDILEKTKMEGN